MKHDLTDEELELLTAMQWMALQFDLADEQKRKERRRHRKRSRDANFARRLETGFDMLAQAGDT
jgi:hypothetical protein